MAYYAAVWVVTHLYVGLALGVAVPAPYWALVLIVLASHIVLDLIPHWDYTHTRHPVFYGTLDFGAGLLTVVVGFFAFGASPWLLLLGILSAAPDFDVLFNASRGRQDHYWWPSHRSEFPHGKAAPLPGILGQVAFIAASCVVLALV